MTSREQFEAWFKSDYHPDKSGSYLKDALFLAWQASRSAIVLDIPPALADDEYFIDGIFQPMRYERDVERAVIRAGLKIKGD